MNACGSRAPRALLAALLVLGAAALAPPPARAQAAGLERDAAEVEGKPIREIAFEGVRRLSQAYLREQIRLKTGDAFSWAALNEDVKRLHGTGKVEVFEEPHVTLVQGLVRLAIRVRELEEAVSVEYEGLKTISERELVESAEGLRLRAPREGRAGTTYADWRANRDVETILRLLREKGKFFAEAEVETVQRDRGVSVVFHVREGPTVRVREIRFTGNDSIPEDRLRQFMRTQTSVLYFIRSGYFDPKTLEDDVQVLERFYAGEGYLDARVHVEDLKFSRDRDSVEVVFRVREGPRYRVRSVGVRGTTLFKPEAIEEKLETREGAFFSGRALAADLERIQKLYLDRGYIFNRVDFVRRFDEKEHVLDLIFEVAEGPPVTLEKVRFTGNLKTRDDVIRRELSLFPGEPFSAEGMDESRDRLGRRGYFRDLRVDFEPGTAHDRRDLVIRLDEQETGQLIFGGGISSSGGFFGRFVFIQRNFDLTDFPGSIDDVAGGRFLVGGGQTLLIEANPGERRSRYTLTFVEPYLLPNWLPLPIQLRATFSFFDSILARTYEEQRIEGKLGLGYRLTRDSLLELAYRTTDISIFGIDTFAPPDVIEVAGDNLVSSLALSYTLDRNRVDHAFTYYGGYGLQAEVEAAGGPAGGDHDFVRLGLSANAQATLFAWPGASKHVLALKGVSDWMREYGSSDDVPVFERVYAGGARSVRGFQTRSVGPQADDEPIGGKVRAVGSLEYSFPLIPGFDETFAPQWRADFLRGVLFMDAGNVESEPGDFSFDDFRVSAGFGFRVLIPVFPAPLALDFGFPIRSRREDDPEVFSFSIGIGGP